MPEYKLTYFNIAALAEPIRWLLKYAKVAFEEERINFEDWPTQKPRFALGQLPLLVEDGKELTQSASILRYLAKKYGLTSGDDFIDYRVDQATEIVTDGRLQWRSFFLENDPEKKEQAKQNLMTTVCPKILKQLNDIVAETDGPFVAGNKVTYGDFVVGNWLQIWTNTVSPTLLDEYPALAKQLEAVTNIPEIKEWLDERPKSNV